MSDRLGELFLQSLSETYKNHYANHTSNSYKSVSERESVPQENEQTYKQRVNSGETASDEEARRQQQPEMWEHGDTTSSHPIRFSENGRSMRAQAAVSLRNRGPAGWQARLLLQGCRQPGSGYLLWTAAWDRGTGVGLLNVCPRVTPAGPQGDMEKGDGHGTVPVTGRGKACRPEWKGVRGCGLSQAAGTGHQRLGSSCTTDLNLSPSWRMGV